MSASTLWTRGEAERAAKSMFGNQALHRAAVAMAGYHPRALDYIRQAPVIVLAENHGRTGRVASAASRQYAGPPMRMLCERGAKLRDVMAFYGCAFQLRGLAPSVLHPVRWAVIDHLGQLSPSTLAQIIPPVRRQQDIWLRALTRWTDHCGRRCSNPWFQFAWAAGALRTAARGQEDTVDTIADLFIEAAKPAPRAGAVLDPRWTLQQAFGATERWHRALARAHAEQKAAAGLGVAFTATVDYAPYPNAVTELDAFTFVPLRSCEELWIEGVQMHHCVGTYSADVMTGRARIYSIQQGGRRVATVEYGSVRCAGMPNPPQGPLDYHRPIQVKGPCNAMPLKAVREAASAFLQQVRADIQQGDCLRAIFPGLGALIDSTPPAGAPTPPTPQASPGPGA